MTKVSIMTDYNKLSELAANKIVSCIHEKPTANICLAGGDTPLGTYEKFIKKVKEQSIDISGVTFVGLDEWVGMDKMTKGSCHHTLNNYLYHPLNISEKQILFFDGKVTPIENECERVSNEINRLGGLDFTLLGVGLNGHLGFNEPRVPVDQWIHVVSLDEITKKVAPKYFETPVKVSKGITLGMKLILSSKKIVTIASGMKKAEIIRKTLEGPIDSNVPSSLLKKHEKAEFILDEEAAEKLKTK